MGAVVVDDVSRLHIHIVHSAIHAHPKKISEYGGIHRPVHQPARSVAKSHARDERMRLGRIDSSLGQFHNHAHSPRVAAQEPVAQSSFHLPVSIVTGHLAVENALGEHCCRQVVAAPYSRNAEEERMVLATLPDSLDAGADVAKEFLRHLPAGL